MFKYKVTIYMKSGKIMRFRLHDYEFDNNTENIKIMESKGFVKPGRAEGVIIKKWWQRWG
jgi:hypothetical protein